MAGYTPDLSEWTQTQDQLADALALAKQTAEFHGDMDGRQAAIEDALPKQDERLKAVESWRKSADATMVLAEKTALDNKTAIDALKSADTSLINRVKPLETWKPQADGRIGALEAKDGNFAGQITSLQSGLTAQTGRIDTLVPITTKLNDNVASLAKALSDVNTALASLATQLRTDVQAINDRLTALEQVPTQPEPSE